MRRKVERLFMAGIANSQQRRKAALGQARSTPALTSKVSFLAWLGTQRPGHFRSLAKVSFADVHF